MEAQGGLAVHGDGPGVGLAEIVEDVHQLPLAIALHAGDAQNLAFSDREGDLVQHLPVPVVGEFEIPYLQHRRPGLGLLLLDGQDHVPAHHQPADLLLGGVGGVVHAHGPAAPQDGHAVRDLLDLLQLVGDEDDGVPLLLEMDQLLEELHRLLGGEHGGGLVQDQDLGAPDQGLQNLHLLLHAHRDVHDLGVGVHFQIKLFAEFLGEGDGLVEIHEELALPGLHAQDHVLRHRQAGHQHEVLMDHADPMGDGHGGGGEGNLFPLDKDFAVGGLLHAEEHLHQGGLARPVLPHEGMDLALLHQEVHPLVGGDAVGVDLVDAPHLNDIFVVLHPLSPSFAFCQTGGRAFPP